MSEMKRLTLRSSGRGEFIDITSRVRREIPAGFDGMCVVFTAHTTAALTINENADPDVRSDMSSDLERLIPPANPAYRHGEGNSAAHLKSSLFSPSLTLIVEKGRLQLGTWQGIYFCEFDGPRDREVLIKCIGGCE